MRIALINASPKATHSSSRTLLRNTVPYFPNKTELEFIGMHGNSVSEETLKRLRLCDAWVVYFPLYVDALPSHFLRCLMQLEKAEGIAGKKLYGVCNCGFFEGEQTDCALELLENFAIRAELKFCGGLGVGAGGMLSMAQGFEDKRRLKLSIIHKLSKLAKAAAKGEKVSTSYTTVDIPPLFYKLGAEFLWRKTLSANGGSVFGLGKRDE